VISPCCLIGSCGDKGYIRGGLRLEQRPPSCLSTIYRHSSQDPELSERRSHNNHNATHKLNHASSSIPQYCQLRINGYFEYSGGRSSQINPSSTGPSENNISDGSIRQDTRSSSEDPDATAGGNKPIGGDTPGPPPDGIPRACLIRECSRLHTTDATIQNRTRPSGFE
jgi:hypothetical protein